MEVLRDYFLYGTVYMDPYLLQTSAGGFGTGGLAGFPAGPAQNKKLWLIGGVACLVIVVTALLWMRRDSGEEEADQRNNVMMPGVGGGFPPAGPSRQWKNTTGATGATGGLSAFRVTEDPIAQVEPDSKLASFAFESLIKPGQVPDVEGRLVQKPAGNPPYKLVQCDDGYAIRWQGRYLTVEDPNKVAWLESKQEPNSCFKIMPGYCGQKQYIMLRSKANALFLRPDGPSNALVCKDTPTARTAQTYCWKLQPDIQGIQPCGCQYSYDLQRVVCTPCNVKTEALPGASCSTVSPGYVATCCLQAGRHKTDAHCKSVVWPEVVGRSVKEAMLVLRTKRPEMVLRPCPEPCTVKAYPVPSRNTIIIPYDARTQIVTSPARVLI